MLSWQPYAMESPSGSSAVAPRVAAPRAAAQAKMAMAMLAATRADPPEDEIAATLSEGEDSRATSIATTAACCNPPMKARMMPAWQTSARRTVALTARGTLTMSSEAAASRDM